MLSDLLIAIKPYHHLGSHNRRMLAAAFTSHFFGFLRISSEFTVPTVGQFDLSIYPTINDIHWSNTHFTFRISHFKTDQLFHGHAVFLPYLGANIYPYKGMARYLSKSHSHQLSGLTPLFTFTSGQPLTRHSCLVHLCHLLQKAHYPPHAFNTHSFRIRAASSAAHMGLSLGTIKHLGRWRSKAYLQYIHPHTPPHNPGPTRHAKHFHP